MNSTHFQRVIEELCQLVGFQNSDILVQGAGKLRINDYLVSFIHDEAYDPNILFVHIDMGPTTTDREDAYKTLLKLNFELAAGKRGVLSIHPETNRLFFSFYYELNEASSGRHLLDSLVLFVGDLTLEALDMSEVATQAGEATATADRAKASRVFATAETPRAGA